MENKRYIRIKGERALSGIVSIDGSKNSALVCMAAACLIDTGKVILTNVPDISDIKVMSSILKGLGKQISYNDGIMQIDGKLVYEEIPQEKAESIRGSIYCLGLMIGMLGKAKLYLPGGDKIGSRPIDIHLDSLESMGMKYRVENARIIACAPEGLHGENIFLRFPSVGATCNVMLAAARANGKTTMYNCAREPEIVDLANLMTKIGVKITGAGSDKIVIYGKNSLNVETVIHEVISDRIETGTFMIAVAMTGGNAILKNCIPYHSYPLISILRKCGVDIEIGDSEIAVSAKRNLKPLKVTMMPFPGISTDLQPLLTALALKINNESIIVDLVFPDRFSYVYEMKKLGADIEREGSKIIVRGGKFLNGTRVKGKDIRAVTALVCTGFIINGVTEIEGVQHIERGYSHFVEKLKNIGANITLIEEK